jgi:hypothetical protein
MEPSGGRLQPDADGMSRRRLLQAAVFGGAGLISVPGAAKGADDGASPAAATVGVTAFQGRLESIVSGIVTLDVDGKAASVALSPNATFWRGSDATSSAVLRPGDDLLIRVEDGLIVRAWANLMRLRGVIEGSDDSGFDLKGGTGYSELRSYGLRLTDGTIFEHAYTGDRRVLRHLPPGTAIDVIGLLDDSILTSSILTYVLPGDRAPSVRPAPVEVTKSRISEATPATPQAVCSYTYSGIASFFYCSSAAKCGTCTSSGGGACAWPYVTTGGTCDFRCTSQVAAWCGKYISVADQCKPQAVTAAVVDCGPCQSPSRCSTPTCGNTCADCKNWRTAIIDLTYATFSLFYDPAKQKCFSCKATNTVSC